MNMKTESKRTDIGAIAPLCLFAFFAICVVTVLFMGAKIYGKQVERDRVGYDSRTVAQYITTRIRQSDKYDAFFIGDFNEKAPKESGNTFFFAETIGEETYYTCIYCHDGYLYELFASGKEQLDVTAGERVLAVKSVSFTGSGKTVSVNITNTDDRAQTLVLYLRSSGEPIS